ncbi:hypothetical protein S-CBP2_0046 [Synechococcus phage S-CBP2]|uniref:Uncharacterized protein n=1 Tax=Synechococcus phage S-CBP2 TaxID=756277 RepID=A0A096VL42_9CAUD|nr:hypothetical protein S-CBP2_0046 [Synechococcus phage S-CBP2]AGF91072.1 hypothetical protein SXHG_00050 [Synechococcus phage MRHenn-2013a]AGK86752.1 hypothetical protein S-CBP2_0046 [Synechococcus phage S-CBP2]
MFKLLEIVVDLLQPQKTWGEFSRRTISLLTMSLLAFTAFDVYWNFIERTDKFIPLHEVVETDPHAFDAVKGLLRNLRQQYPAIQAIWLYSWPDAANVERIHVEGDSLDPLPVGHFWKADAHDVGKLSLRICTELNRNPKNTACAVYGQGDAWGLIVVVWQADHERPEDHADLVGSLAQRISHLIYKNHD